MPKNRNTGIIICSQAAKKEDCLGVGHSYIQGTALWLVKGFNPVSFFDFAFLCCCRFK